MGKSVRYHNWDWDEEDLDRNLENLLKYDELVEKKEKRLRVSDLEKIRNEANFNNRTVVADPPGIGKTTTIRQYFVDRLKGGDLTYSGLYCTQLEDDAFNFFKDLVTFHRVTWDKNITYPYKSSPRIVICTSKYKNFESLEDLQNANIIICTHRRLFISPPYLIYKVPYAELASRWSSDTPSELSYRQDIFIDEIPNNLFEYVNVSELGGLHHFNRVIGSMSAVENTKYSREMQRAAIIDAVHQNLEDILKSSWNKSLLSRHDDLNDRLPQNMDAFEGLSIVRSIHTPTKVDLWSDAKRGVNSLTSKMNREALIFFANLYAEKLEESPGSNYLLYSFDDFICKNMVIFSGTGDLVVKNSSRYNIVNHYPRELKLDIAKLVKTQSVRSSKPETISREYTEILRRVLNENPDDKILLYTWKSFRGSFNVNESVREIIEDETITNSTSEIGNLILSELSEEDRSRISVIHYQSGKELTTSQYIDGSVLVILGDFFIPNEIIHLRNEVFHNTGVSDDEMTRLYTMHLMIQCIYRIQSRSGNPIKLYLDSKYDEEFRSQLLSKFKLTGKCREFDSEVLDVSPAKVLYEETRNRIIELIKSVGTRDESGNYVVTSSEVYDKLIGNSKIDNAKIKRKLDSYEIEYEYIEGRKGGNSETRVPSKFVVTNT